MAGELVNVHVGQAGCQLGHALWELFCLEHSVRTDGRIARLGCNDEGRNVLFDVRSGRAHPRVVMCDTEPTVIDEVRHGAYRELFKPRSLVSYLESSAGNFAVGRNVVGPQLLPAVMDELRAQLEACDSARGCLLHHSLGGGTGSGFTTLLMKSMRDEFAGLKILQMAVYPSPRLACGVVEPFNTVAAMRTQSLLADAVLLFDNEAMYSVVRENLGQSISSSDYTVANRLTAQFTSSLTAGFRYNDGDGARFEELTTNLVPYPLMHYLVPSFAPICAVGRSSSLAIDKLIGQALSNQNTFVKVNVERSRLACALMFRGQISPAEGNQFINRHKGRQMKFEQWMPTGVHASYCYNSPTQVSGTGIYTGDRALAVVSNTLAVAVKFRNISAKFRRMYASRTHIHTYLANGYSDAEFQLDLDFLDDTRRNYARVAESENFDMEDATDSAEQKKSELRRMRFRQPK